jgi:hypothetical protein
MDQNDPSLKTNTGDIFQIPNNKIMLMDKKNFIILHVSFSFI